MKFGEIEILSGYRTRCPGENVALIAGHRYRGVGAWEHGRKGETSTPVSETLGEKRHVTAKSHRTSGIN